MAGPCEAEGLPRARGRRGSESRARTAPPAAPHLPPEPPARAPALVPQQHLRGEHQKSAEPREVAALGQRGTRPGRGEGLATPPAPRPSPPLSVVLSAVPSGARSAPQPSMRILGVEKGAGGRRVETVSGTWSAQVRSELTGHTADPNLADCMLVLLWHSQGSGSMGQAQIK